MAFSLHPQLAADTVTIGYFALSHVLLSKDANYPWCILVPRREGVTEIHQLVADDRSQLLIESCQLAETMVAVFQPDKMNVAALGNVVAQLHLHHVARYRDDPTWPGPIWGQLPAIPYSEEKLHQVTTTLCEALSEVATGFSPAI